MVGNLVSKTNYLPGWAQLQGGSWRCNCATITRVNRSLKLYNVGPPVVMWTLVNKSPRNYYSYKYAYHVYHSEIGVISEPQLGVLVNGGPTLYSIYTWDNPRNGGFLTRIHQTLNTYDSWDDYQVSWRISNRMIAMVVDISVDLPYRSLNYIRLLHIIYIHIHTYIYIYVYNYCYYTTIDQKPWVYHGISWYI